MPGRCSGRRRRGQCGCRCPHSLVAGKTNHYSETFLASHFKPAVGSLVQAEVSDVAWTDDEVLEVNGEEFKVLCTLGKLSVVKASKVYAKVSESRPCGVDDMTTLAYLYEPGVLKILRSRYDIDKIYTYVSNILIAVNPCKRLPPHLYDSHMMAKYKGAAFGELSPHPFAVADDAHRLMINGENRQAILVSGESGAGKTETIKFLLDYLAHKGGRAAADAEGVTVDQRVLESIPVLKAFGNAKTVRNNNSSRFGKFMEIQFDKKGRISGATIKTYLLERSRVCNVSVSERNYHCFYMLCAAPPEDVQRYKLENPRTFYYLNQSNCYELDGVDDSKEYIKTRRAMDVVGISVGEQDAIFRVVAAILHLGNVEFAKGKETDSSIPKDEKSWFHLRTAAELFMCDAKALEDSLCKHVIVTRDETIAKHLNPESAVVSRDGLAKIVYTRLFGWLVDKMNSSINQDPESKFLIGVLDINGFEGFKKNSFEQFCINLTNEKFQQHFNQHVFKMEREEYTKEEIEWSRIDFVDNQDILDLIEKTPGGIIALLDEACKVPKSTHETFAQKLYQTFNHKRFSKPKLSRSDFTIFHYAGDVTYQTELFLDKNKDYVVAEHQALLSASRCSFVAGLFPPSAEDSSKRSFSSIGSQFKKQLQDLLNALSTFEPHYIRCVKPNHRLKPSTFENKIVLQQLHCGGVMEAIRISCAGFPTKKPFAEFVDRFGVLVPEVLDRRYDGGIACKRLLEKVGLKGYQIGKTKVFLKAGQMAELDAHRSEVLGRSAAIIQRKVSSYLARKNFFLLRESVVQIQAACRGKLARQLYEGMRREYCLKIQTEIQLKKNKATFEKELEAAKRAAERLTNEIEMLMADMEEAKTQIKKLQFALQEMQLQLKENKEMFEKEREDAKRAAERLTSEKEMLMADMEEDKTQKKKLQLALQEMQLQLKENKAMFEKEREDAKRAAERLTSEKEMLMVKFSSVEMKIDETEKKYEANKISEQRLLKHTSEEIIQLKTTIWRLESENKLLRQQVLLILTPVEEIPEHPPTPATKENVDALISCVTKNIGFSHGTPVAALMIYKCLLNWKSFEAERTSVFDRLIHMIGSAIEDQDNNNHMSYWLSNTSTLLILLQRNLKGAGVSGATPHRKPPPPTSLLGRMTMGFHSSHSLPNLPVASRDVVCQVEANYPALLFKQQLTALVEKIYATIRDNLKKELASLLYLCIQVPRKTKGILRSGRSFGKDSPATHWQSIIERLNILLNTLKETFVPPILVQKIFTQTFSYINLQLFNSLLLRRECCTFSNGEYLNAGLAELEQWYCQAKEQYAGSSWDELKHLRQAVGFLVIHQKDRMSWDEITNDHCPILSVQQLYRLSTLFWDENNTERVSPDVISSMRLLMTEDSNNAPSNSFLLEDDSSIPFSVDDLSTSLHEKDFSDVKPAD